MSGRSILVIEDNPDNLDIMRLVLRAAGFTVSDAADGETGLKLARQLHPDLIVLDLMLPGIDGWTLARQLRADPDLAYIPILAVSAYASSDSRSRAAQAGVDDFVPKPIDLYEFPKLVTQHLTAKRILVIEDDPDNLDIVRQALKAEGYAVVEARDGETGFQLAQATHPDLVVLDMVLPRMDGWDVARKLRADPDLKDIPVFAVSAYDSSESRMRATEAGCDEFVLKPLDLQQFPTLIESYLSQGSINPESTN